MRDEDKRMTVSDSTPQRLALGLAVLGSLIALGREALRYSRGEGIDIGHVALAIGVPALFFAMLRRPPAKPPIGP